MPSCGAEKPADRESKPACKNKTKTSHQRNIEQTQRLDGSHLHLCRRSAGLACLCLSIKCMPRNGLETCPAAPLSTGTHRSIALPTRKNKSAIRIQESTETFSAIRKPQGRGQGTANEFNPRSMPGLPAFSRSLRAHPTGSCSFELPRGLCEGDAVLDHANHFSAPSCFVPPVAWF